MLDMSSTPDLKSGSAECASDNVEKNTENIGDGSEKIRSKVSFPASHDKLVTGYLEPPDPWKNVTQVSKTQLISEYEECCVQHNVSPIPSVIQQIQELPDEYIGCAKRAPRLSLAGLELTRKHVDSLEALFRRVQYVHLDVCGAALPDEACEAIFDIIEYYESATSIDLTETKDFAIRGWQALSRCIKKTWSLQCISAGGSILGESHAAVLARSLKPSAITALRLHAASLCGLPLTCLAMSLKQNATVRELRLSDNGLHPSDASQLATLLRHNTVIHHLDLSDNMIQDAGVKLISEALVEQARNIETLQDSRSDDHHEERGLAVLVLWNNQLTRHCTEHLNKALLKSPSLCVLNVGRNALGSEAVSSLRGPRLLSLGLQAARLSTNAAPALVTLLQHHNKLQRLDVRDNALKVCALKALVQAVNNSTSLSRLDIDEPQESSSLQVNSDDLQEVKSLIREIKAACKKNEVSSKCKELPPHRRISLTVRAQGHTSSPGGTALQHQPLRNTGGTSARLRSPSPSPAPSPAGSPTPHGRPQQQARFSVSRVTSDAGNTPTASNRFRVIQVTESPQMTVDSSVSPPKSPMSRFSVKRNTDAAYRCDKKDKEPVKIVVTDVSPVTETKPICSSDSSNVKNDVFSDKCDSTVTLCDTDKCDKSDDCRKISQSNVQSESVLNTIQSSDIETSDTPLHRLEEITDDLSHLIEEMQVLSEKSAQYCKKTVLNTDDIFSVQVDKVLEGDKLTLKKNKSESSLDSPDLEVSRLMRKEKKVFYDSSSSLEISGSSVESLNNAESADKVEEIQRRKVTVKLLNLEEINKRYNEKKKNEHPLSNESSIEDPNTYLNSSLSSNDSVSPNAFGKHLQIHGSLSSLETSSDSAKSIDKVFFGSGESTIQASVKNTREDNSSNECTLTSDSALKTDKPKERTRKISWVAPPNFQFKVDSKPPSHLEKLLSLFQHPTSLFTRQNDPQKDNQSTSFWSWGLTDLKSDSPDTDTTLSHDAPSRTSPSTVTNSDSEMSDCKVTTDEVQILGVSLDSNLDNNSEILTQECIENVCERTEHNTEALECNLDEQEPNVNVDIEQVDVAKDALSYLDSKDRTLYKCSSHTDVMCLADELKAVEIASKSSDLSPELVVEETSDDNFKKITKKSNSLEEISGKLTDEIKNKVPTLPKNIPKVKSGRCLSPKSLPESLSKLRSVESSIVKKKTKKINLGKITKDSLLALNRSEDELCELKRSHRLTSVDSLKSLESSGDTSCGSRCKTCLRHSQESLLSLDSISEDCDCSDIKR